MGLRRVGHGKQVLVALFAGLAVAACGEADDSGGSAGMLSATGGVGGGGGGGMGAVAGMGAGMAGAAGGTAGMGGGAPATDDIPCDVKQIITTHCQTCHGATPVGGAPMPLVTLADFQKDHTVASPLSGPFKGMTMKVHQIVKIRMNQEMGTSPMPPTGMLTDDLATVNAWLAGGAQAGAACGGIAGQGGVGGMETGGAGGMAGGGAGSTGNPGDKMNLCLDSAEDAFAPLVARPGETCYEFLTHNGGMEGDPFIVPIDESYSQLYYDIPWPADAVATRFGADFDNINVLHHWLGFETNENQLHGAVVKNVTGSTGGDLGGGYTTKLVGGWAVGGCNISFPSDTALELADPGTGQKFMVQWHHYNFTGTPQPDASKIQVCTVPQSMVSNVAGLTWLGTENLGNAFLPGDGMQPGMTTVKDGTCLNETSAPITIIGFWPHMHEIGTNMYTEIIPANGGAPVPVFDEPFKFNAQYAYIMDPRIVMQPGDKVRAECTFVNTTTGEVDFGQSSKQEMCYQFAFSYPAGALDKPGNSSLIGANNTCWGD